MNTNLIGKTCFPDEFLTRKKFIQDLSTLKDIFKDLSFTLYITIDLIIILSVFTVFFGFILFILMKKPKVIKIIIWSMIFLLLFL